MLWRHKKKANIEAKEQPKDNDIKQWITVNGVHIPIKKGQNKDDVVSDFISKQKDDEPKKDTPKTDKNTYSINDYKKTKNFGLNDSDSRSNHLNKKYDAMSDIDLAIQNKTLIIPDEELKRSNSSDSEDYMSLLTSRQGVRSHEQNIEINKKWDYLEQHYLDKKEFKKYKELKNEVDEENKKILNEYKSTKSFFRGTRIEELDSYIDNGVNGSKESAFNYMAVTSSPDSSSSFGGEVSIEYDGTSIRNIGKLVTYTQRPQSIVSYDIKDDISGFNMDSKYSHERETRIPKGVKIKDLGIKNIYINKKSGLSKKEAETKYGSLGNIIFVDNDNFDWSDILN